MNRRQIALVMSVVILAHLGLFYFISHTSALPKTPFIPLPNFIAREASWVDEKTGETVTYREYQVSTKLAEEKARAAKVE